MSEDLTGRRLGHYRIDGVLGRGGMSVMYKATDVRLGRKVALKVIGEHLGDDMEFRERFVDEARNTSAIDHANVVPLYDFGEVDGLLYIAMRLVDGSDLASLISDGPISPERALALLGQVAGALDTLHERGLVHLDLKPANVLVTSRETANEHVYLADFGLTRRGVTGHRTRTGDFLGSPTYAAPEHLRGEPVDGRADAYSLGCMLFACLTGRPPFQGDVQDVIKGHLSLDPPPIIGLVRLPVAIDEVIRRALAKDADSRYPNCRELMGGAKTALAEVADPSVPPVLAGGQPAPQQQPSPASRGPAGPGAAQSAQPRQAPQASSGQPAAPNQAGPSSPAGRSSPAGPHGHNGVPEQAGQRPYGGTPPPAGAQYQPGAPNPTGQPPNALPGAPGHPGYPGAPQYAQPAPYGYQVGPPSGPQQLPRHGPPPGPPPQAAPHGYPAEPDPAQQQPPMGTTSGGSRAGRPQWLLPVVCGALAIVAIIVFIAIFLSGDGDRGRNSDNSMRSQHVTEAPRLSL